MPKTVWFWTSGRPRCGSRVQRWVGWSDAGALRDRSIHCWLIDLQTILAIVARADLIEHTVVSWVRQRVFGMALSHEDLNDYDDMRRDPVTGALESQREDCAPVAGKSTLNRLELSPMFNAVSPYHFFEFPLPRASFLRSRYLA